MSRTALQETDVKLSGRGFCCLADICRLPFKEGVFDAAVSGYTIQHIPESQQSQAVGELYRVLKPGGHLCVISGIQLPRAHQALLTAMRAVRKIQKILGIISRRIILEPSRAGGSSTPPHKLYYLARDLRWWREMAGSLTDAHTLEGFRLFRKEEFQLLFGESARTAKVVRALEMLFPRLAARMCAYVLVDLKKPSS
jgi:SAM-dependent methyltransferase